MKGLFTMIIVTLCVTLSQAQTSQTASMTIKPIKGMSTTVTTKSVKAQAPIPSGQVYNLDTKIPKTQEQCLKDATPTSNTAIFKNNNHPVYSTSKGKLFIVLPNKENTGYYRKYIPTQLVGN